MATYISTTEETECQVIQQNSSALDLVFAMDCTGSMGAYIHSATQNIRLIVDEIVANERSDIHLALIEYRDHPPQDATFVTRVHDFTDKVDEMKRWLTQCSAEGGGDTPEAVADALHDVLNLTWRGGATKICILISDAPPHGLGVGGDYFPNGCPAGFDPIKVVRQMAENNITLYVVGVEPPIIPYRDFFMSLAYITGGQYVPLANANLLAQVIVSGVREEISLERLMSSAREDIAREIQQAEEEGINDEEAAVRISHILRAKNTRVKRMRNASGATSKIVEECYSKCNDMNEMQSKYKVSRAKRERKTEESSYTLEEDSVTLEQAKRLVQKAKNRKMAKTPRLKSDETNTTEKRPRRRNNNRDDDDQKQENEKPRRQNRRRTKGDATEIIDVTESNESKEEDSLNNDQIMKTETLEDQAEAEKREDNVRKRRGKRRNPVDADMPKEKVKRQSRRKLKEIADSSTVSTIDISEPMLDTDTIDDDIVEDPIQYTEPVHSPAANQPVQSTYNNIYLILFAVLTVLIVAYFLLLK